MSSVNFVSLNSLQDVCNSMNVVEVRVVSVGLESRCVTPGANPSLQI